MNSNIPPRPLIFGEVLFDCFEDGNLVLGGAPFNVAWHLQAFGQAPLLVSRVGDDPLGRRIRSAMQAWDMDCAGLQLDSAHPTGTVQVTMKGGEPAFEIVSDRAYDFIDDRALPPLDSVSLLYHGSLALRNPVSRHALVALQQRSNASVFIDVNLRPPWWDKDEITARLRNARWVKLNAGELQLLAPPGGDVAEQAEALQSRYGIDQLFVTRGANGAFARTSTGEIHQVTPSGDLEIADTVGAGDAFASVLLLGLANNWPLPLLLERAQAFAGAVVGIQGATVDDRNFYQPFLSAWSRQ